MPDYRILIDGKPHEGYPPVQVFLDAITSFTAATRAFPKATVLLKSGRRIIGQWPKSSSEGEEEEGEEE